ncbi:CTP synthase [bacterium]|nr:CTP synthase [bacterium]HDJ30435.1 CTP synthase [bacterium]
MTRYIFIIGGVMSGIGKGIATASIGKILQAKGYKVTAIKIDPYVNVDAGTMNPIEHGEIFVTKDGVECDQDIGNYERFLDEELTTDNYITTGRVYQAVIQRERNLEYGGRCVEVVPDIPNETISRIKKAAKKTKADFVLIEIGGTVGEYQNMLFLEAARMMKLHNPKKVLFILISYLPVPETIGEMKTKPTQQAVKWLNMAGIQPSLIIARSKFPLDQPRKRKISIFCNVDIKDVISSPDVESVYEIPVNFAKERLGDRILHKFGLHSRRSCKKNLQDWEKLVKIIKTAKKPVKVAMVGKYFETGKFTLMDSYISVIEAIKHASWYFRRKPEIQWLSAENYEKKPRAVRELEKFDGVIVPGGFGSRGVEGKIKAIEFCRTHKIPYLGLCFGMQLAVIEFARNVAGIKDANSAEFNPGGKNNVIDIMPEQKVLLREKRYGATMRLGDYLCRIKKGTISFKAYKKQLVVERHRHRYEVNNSFRELLEKKGLVIAGVNPERDLVEIIEYKNHPFFVATQFHPEYKSRPLRPHPLFREFIRACTRKRS